MELTLHYKESRGPRYEFIKNTIGFGEALRSFRYDRGHPNGAEIHTVTSTAIIIVRNERTKKLVTLLIARPRQIERLYETVGEKAPKELLDLARQHEEAGYNMR